MMPTPISSEELTRLMKQPGHGGLTVVNATDIGRFMAAMGSRLVPYVKD